MFEIIDKKMENEELSREEIGYFVRAYTGGEVNDDEAAELIRAIYSNGMTDREITDLTLEMAYSGEVVDLSKLGQNVVDKHSTGGIGDKVTLILMPIIAALGIPVAKMSGRGLGYTGGTIDKLESIPGYNTQISVDELIENVRDIGICLMGQTLNLAPADKKIYELRDAINCVESIPLIASSIMSKKIAAGANKIVLEVTVGNGAFMKNIEDARKLSETMINIGKLTNKEVVCVLTNMDEPLGYSIGNTLEVIEAVEALEGDMEEDVKQVVLELGSYMIKLAGHGDDIEDNKRRMRDCLDSGNAYMKFLELVENQGGDISYINDVSKFANAKFVMPVLSDRSGYVGKINAEKLGIISCKLGAGREKKDDVIDNQVGLIINKKIGESVEEKEIIGIIHANDEALLKNAVDELKSCFEIVDTPVDKPKVILEIIK
ncbi:MAG: thymidine phosphorylase [Clostridia bacterium]|nr:thymidine phosphorylase [Clostridia bacterium]